MDRALTNEAFREMFREVAADKGHHAAETIEMCDFLDVRSYIPEPRRAYDSRWTDKPDEYRRAVVKNRRRVKRAKSKALQRRQSEVVERTFAHICDTGGARRSWLRGFADVSMRYLMAAPAHNWGRLMRRHSGIGKPKALQGEGGRAALAQLLARRLQCDLAALIDRTLRRPNSFQKLRQVQNAEIAVRVQ